MKITRAPNLNQLKPLWTKDVKIYWCSDGWSYIPALQLRRRFFMMDSTMNYIEESYEGIIPLPVHKEELEYSVYSEDPLIWGEKSELYFEVK